MEKVRSDHYSYIYKQLLILINIIYVVYENLSSLFVKLYLHAVTIPDVWIGEMKPHGDLSVLVRCLSSDNNAELQWFKVDITEGTRPVPAPLAIDGNLEVDLNDLSETNHIDYYCTATNSFGAARTVPFRAYSPSCTYYGCLILHNIYYFSLNRYHAYHSC